MTFLPGIYIYSSIQNQCKKKERKRQKATHRFTLHIFQEEQESKVSEEKEKKRFD
jgi:hypothetical protein